MLRRYRIKFKNKSNEQKEPISKRKIIISILIIFFAFFGSFLIYFILSIALNTETPMVVVVSGSMEPNINKGDLLFIQGRDPEDIKESTGGENDGDVIVFDAHGLWAGAPDEPIVHRVVDKYEEDGKWYFETKGDANDYKDDEPIPENRVKGVVVGRVPYVGWIKIVLADYGLFIPVLIILSVPLIVSIIWDIVKGEKEKTEKEKQDIEPEIEESETIKEEKKIISKKETDKIKDDEFDI